ncbi:MAG: cytochrome c [Planctomycetes bacterium]|nr:cytochrome c [Planctomycetota bacterium]
MKLTVAACLVALPLVAALSCRTSEPEAAAPHPPARTTAKPIAPPIALEGKAYEAAAKVELPKQAPTEMPGLHNIYRLSPDIVSGSEPHGHEGLESMAEMGIRTVISVDGSAPDAAAAAKLGLRYVHVPIQYKGITNDEVAKLVKTFRELEPPFYVHCFHGKHRGPAAAALGRVALDGAPRDVAIAEMRQYCGTAGTYEGLYQVIAKGAIPSEEETAALRYDFAPVHQPKGMVGAMSVLARAHDNVADAMKREWAADAAHPDLDALNEAEKLEQAFAAAFALDETQQGPADQKQWFERSSAESKKLVEALKRLRAGEAAAGEEAKQAFKAVKGLCTECHSVYRN